MLSIRKKYKQAKPISAQSRLALLAEKKHIQAHLALTELQLRIKSKHKNRNRQLILDALHGYWKNGVFPINNYIHGKRMPVFIDENGTYCAVGYLMAQTGNATLAQNIDRQNKFIYVEELKNPDVAAWLDEHDITQKEAAQIQPAYQYTIERINYTMLDKVTAIGTIFACLLIMLFIGLLIILLRNKKIEKVKKRRYVSGIAMAAILIVAGFVWFLPSPKNAISAITSGNVNPEKKTCYVFEGESAPECELFHEKGEASGWKQSPCKEGAVLLGDCY